MAGPDVFRTDAVKQGHSLKKICRHWGFQGLFPLDNERSNSKEIYETNFDMVKDCDVVLANMHRFRGPSMDVGTAWEIGAASALNKPVILYNSDKKQYKQFAKVENDSIYCIIEDFGLEDNLMLIHCADHISSDISEALDYIKDKYAT